MSSAAGHHAGRCGRDRPAHAGDEGKLGAMISASHHAAHGPAARAPLRCRADEGMPRVIMPVDVVVTDLHAIMSIERQSRLWSTNRAS
jgi:hypothetical protein